ncbi:MAG: dehydrogenase [Proteobacteria bacterium]|nr:dehydrogenase [Desulfocapsa sp.]MBU3946390.1 dehydrogenase [Pseudomonadota bacterium]MCG2743768.1 dehydrogenase [Desulfobacteraceae bacterium]MBU4027279.1 dehydrogenase [Pseudomonadota bacterium]MBU4041413.1 dehydrogenase [Pseudomonadota bacterium]
MDLILNNLHIPIEQDGMNAYIHAASQKMKIGEGDIVIAKILSKSLDLGNKEQLFYKISLVVSTDDSFANKQKFPLYIEAIQSERKIADSKERPIIVGFGPAGMFAALELIDYGFTPLIFERGKKIEERSLDVQRFIKERKLDSESNIQFGEGGAGSYSDGKLFSRRNQNTSYVNRVLQTFIKFGAPAEIGYISKPHLGTDVLCRIVRNIRLYILERGGEILYGSKMTDLLISEGVATGIIINGEKEYLASSIYIALGHSARDTVVMLHEKGVALEQRPISVGVRIEHPVETINLMRYGDKYKDFPGLGAATYSLNYTNRQIRRGVYTFCMCPGGEVVNASSEPGMLVLNGMSYSQRSSPFSNAALVVSCHAEDYQSASPLAGIEFQKDVERKVFAAGGGNWQAPAQNLLNFLGESSSVGLHQTSYKMGVVSADMKEIFPGFVVEELSAAFHKWKEEVPLFVSSQAILLAAETRTSSPVRIQRNEKYESVNIKNLYPIGEGSGYTGGITSSAADAIRAVEIHISEG